MDKHFSGVHRLRLSQSIMAKEGRGGGKLALWNRTIHRASFRYFLCELQLALSQRCRGERPFGYANPIAA